MSDVKYQLRTLLPSLSADARRLTDAEVKKRFYAIKHIAESSRSLALACRHEGKSEAWFYKWADRLIKTKCLSSLKSRSRRPKHSPRRTPPRVIKRIRRLREVEAFSGPERISQDLKDLYNIRCAPSTVHRVLQREDLISKARAKRLTKKHLKRYRRPELGYLQMDFKHVPYQINGQQYYQLSVVDHHSSWRLVRAYSSKSTAIVLKFLEELLSICPFAILEIQTDNDAAFTDKFTSQRGEAATGLHAVDEWCARHEIRHRLIPPGVKELNGKVENTHKQDDREHFAHIHPLTLKALVVLTRLYNERWNDRRKTKALGWRTPSEVVAEAQVRSLAWLLLVREKYLRKDGIKSEKPLPPWLANLAANQPKQTKSKTRTTRKSAVDRYLQWLDEDEKSRKKA